MEAIEADCVGLSDENQLNTFQMPIIQTNNQHGQYITGDYDSGQVL